MWAGTEKCGHIYILPRLVEISISWKKIECGAPDSPSDLRKVRGMRASPIALRRSTEDGKVGQILLRVYVECCVLR